MPSTATPRVSRRSRVAPDVEDRLHAGAHHGDARAAERHQVGRLVEGGGRAAVDATEAAGGEHADPRLGAARCEVAATVAAPWPAGATTVARSRTLTLATSSALAIGVEGVVVEPDPHDTGDDRDGRRDGAGAPHRLLDLPRDREVVGAGQAVADDRRLEGDHRLRHAAARPPPPVPGRSSRRRRYTLRSEATAQVLGPVIVRMSSSSRARTRSIIAWCSASLVWR